MLVKRWVSWSVAQRLVHGEPYARQPNRARADVQVHEEVNNAALQVVLDTVDENLSTNVHDLEVGKIVLITILIDGLVDLFVMTNPLSEILRGFLRILANIIGAAGLNVADVGHDQFFVVALGFHKQDFNSLAANLVEHPFAALFCAVCSVEDAHDAALLFEPLEHV